jgi:hypothetical protein
MDGSPVAGRTAGQRRYDRVTVALLMAGGLLLFAGWPVGVAMLWAGPRWSKRDRLLGTLVWPLGPGGLILLFALLPASTRVCVSGGPGVGQNCTTSGWSLPGWLGATILAAVLLTAAAVARRLTTHAARPARE